ncbi:MAG: hypothetical protein D6805_00995 [Planctomycetota bacterium]|nr:MAG: hypothetical protein D6805_00995 [Planctomycetota bacterium]
MTIFKRKDKLLSHSSRLFYFLAILLWNIGGCRTQHQNTNLFGIYISTLDGRNMRVLVSDPYREMNHARVSPDQKWVTFTRYNKRGPKGLAMEKGGYEETEIMIIRLDGTGLESIVPPKKGIVAANGYWTPDGKGILYVSTDNPERKPQINLIDLKTRRIIRIPTPEGFWVADPHQVKDRLVFSVIKKGKKVCQCIWTMKVDGKDPVQLTSPKISSKKRVHPPLGDFDPKLSPDGKRVALMRQVKERIWHVVIVDLENGKEMDISPFDSVDAVPEWSSDGRLLIFWHVDPKRIKNSGLYTMRPDGKERKRIPLPHGYFYTMPAFFPREGPDGRIRIIFSARKDRRF